MCILLYRAHRTQTQRKMTSSLSSSGSAPTAFKLFFSGETRRFAVPRSWDELQGQAQILWGSCPYVFTYT